MELAIRSRAKLMAIDSSVMAFSKESNIYLDYSSCQEGIIKDTVEQY